MRILFTGASSFTGYWFVKTLAAAGHEVTATFTAADIAQYSGLRRQRIEALPASVERSYDITFGSEKLLTLIARNEWDLFCHHGAVVGSTYKSGSFDGEAALRSNTLNAATVLEALKKSGCSRMMLTGTYFETGEGAASESEAVSPYGLSKTLTWQAFRYLCDQQAITLGKFVIPNPFGALEESRLSSYLAKCWLAGVEPSLKTPDYVRDYIPVDLMAASYLESVEALTLQETGIAHFSPSFWVESNLAFAHRMSQQLAPILGVDCPVCAETQTDFSEPLSRHNTQPLAAADFEWDEGVFWNQLASYYQDFYKRNTS